MSAVEFCLDHGADINAKDVFSYTALHGAAYRGDNPVVKFLVEKGAKMDVKSRTGYTVTDMANGPKLNAHLPIEHPDTVALLQKLGAPAPEAPAAGDPKPSRPAAEKPEKFKSIAARWAPPWSLAALEFRGPSNRLSYR